MTDTKHDTIHEYIVACDMYLQLEVQMKDAFGTNRVPLLTAMSGIVQGVKSSYPHDDFAYVVRCLEYEGYIEAYSFLEDIIEP